MSPKPMASVNLLVPVGMLDPKPEADALRYGAAIVGKGALFFLYSRSRGV